MTDIAILGIGVDSRPVDQAVKSLADLAKQGAATEQAVKKSGRESGKAYDGLKRELKDIQGEMLSLRRAASGLVGVLSVREISRISDSYSGLTAQLKLATTSTAEYGRAYADVRSIAKSAQSDLEGTATLYARIANSTRELGLSQQKIAQITESVSLAMRVSGATAQESASAMLQLSQAFAAGTLRGQEFNAVSTSAPRLMKALADGMSVPIGALRTMAAEGKITSEVMAEALPAALEQLKGEAAHVQNIGGAVTNLRNEVLELVGTQAQASGFVSTLTGGFNLLAGNLKEVVAIAGTIGAGHLAQTMASWAKRAYEAAAASRALALAQASVSQSSRAASIGMTALRAATAITGGGVGLLTVAAIAGAAAWSSYKSRTDEVRKSLTDLTQPLDEVMERFKKMTQLEQSKALEGLKEAAVDAAKAVEEAFDRLEKVPGKLRASQEFKEFKRQLEDLRNSNLGADELDAQVSKLVQAFLTANPHISRAREAVEQAGIAVIKAARASEDYAERVKAAEGATEGFVLVLDKQAIAAAKAAAGLQTEEWSKYINKLESAATTVGMTAQQMAQFEANSMGASAAQAQLAGVLAGMANAARTLEDATAEKDDKATSGAKAILAALAAQEVQLRVNIRAAQEYASLLAMGLTQAEASKFSAGIAEGARAGYEAEVLKRINDLYRNIAANTAPAATKASNSARDAISNTIKSLEQQARAVGLSADKLTLYELATKGATKAQLAQAKAALDTKRAAELTLILSERQLDLSNAAIQAVAEETARNQALADTFGMSARAIEEQTIARLEDVFAQKQAANADAEELERLRALIKLRRQNAAALSSTEAQEAAQKAREEYESGWKQTTDSIGQSLTDALLRGFESGKSFAQNLRDTVINMFKTMVLQPVIQPVMAGVAGSVMGMLGLSGPANAATGGGVLSNLGGLGNFLGGGSLSGIVQSAGGWLAQSGIAPDLGANIVMNADKIGAFADMAGQFIGYGKAIFDVTKGNYGSAIGSAIGTYVLPGIGTAVGSVLGGFADKLFGSKDTRHGGTYIWEAGRGYSQHDGGWQSGNPGAEVGNAVNQMVQSAAEMANRAFNAVGSEIFVSKMHGILESSEKDRGGTASGGWIVGVGGLTAAEAASYVPGRDDPLAWLPGPDGGRRFGTFGRGQGHGEQSGDLQQMMEWLAVDLQQSIIESWQVGIDAFPSIIRDMIGGIDPNSLDASQSAALVQQVLSTIEGVKAAQAALSELPMEAFSNLSFDAAASLLKVSGSIENLIGVIQTYSDAAFTDAEKVEMAQGRLSDAFAQLGLEVPTSVQALRALVDAQGMATEEDQRRTLALMSLAPALVEVTAAAEAMAERMRGLTATYFSLFKSSQEQYDLAARDLAAQFEKLGYALPKTASEYTYLVDSIDMSTASSRALKEQLLALAQPMRTLIDQAAELAKAAGESVKTGFSVNEIYEQQIAIVEQLRAKVAGLSAEVQTAFANRAMAQSLSAQISEALGQGVSTAARQADLWNQVRADITPGQRLDAAQELIGLLTHIPAPDTSTQQAAVAAAQEARAVAEEQRSAAQAAMSAAQQQLSAAKSLQDAGRRLREYVQGLRTSDLSPLTMAEKVAEAAGHYQRTLSAAQGGDEEALRNLQSVSSTYLDLARQFYASNQAYTDIFNNVTGALDGLGAGLLGQGNSAASIAQAQLSAAEAALAVTEQQLLAAAQQIEAAQSQLEIARVGNGLSAEQITQLKDLQQIIGVIEADADASFKSLSSQLAEELAILDSMEKALGLQSTVPGLLAGLPAGIAAALAPLLDANANKYVQGLYQEFLSRPADQEGMDYWREQFGQSNKGLSDYLWSANEEMIRRAYQQVLGRDADAEGLEHYARQMQSGKSIDDILKELEWAKMHGSHAAGLSYVPFDGYRAQLHKGERVLTAQENREYSAINWNRYGRGDDAMRAVVAELRAVKQEVSELRAQQAQASATDTQVQLQVGEKVARAVQSGIAEGVETGRTRNVRLA